MNMPTLTIPSFLADLKVMVEKAGVTPNLKGSTICFNDNYSCALDFYLRQKDAMKGSYTDSMEALGMSESDAWTIMSANDNCNHKSRAIDQEVRAALLALIPCP